MNLLISTKQEEVMLFPTILSALALSLSIASDNPVQNLEAQGASVKCAEVPIRRDEVNAALNDPTILAEIKKLEKLREEGKLTTAQSERLLQLRITSLEARLADAIFEHLEQVCGLTGQAV